MSPTTKVVLSVAVGVPGILVLALLPGLVATIRAYGKHWAAREFLAYLVLRPGSAGRKALLQMIYDRAVAAGTISQDDAAEGMEGWAQVHGSNTSRAAKLYPPP